jgi:hypothetical protein
MTGIYILTKENEIVKKREPIEFNSLLDHTRLFKLLRKGEYNIIQNEFDHVPYVAPVFYFKCCLQKFQQIPIKKAQA